MPAAEPALERLADVASLSSPSVRRRMLVIVNPYATTMSDRLKHLVVYALQGRYQVEAVDTQRRGHATELCAAAAREGYDVVCAFGGDGTVNEAANGLAGSQTPLTVLPGGSTNVYCRMLGIPDDVVDATEHLLGVADHFQPRRVDLGRLDDRWFTFAAGMGLDASVVERVDRHPHLKARLGHWYFTGSALSVFLRRYVVNPPQIDVTVGGATHRGVSVLVQNASPYTYWRHHPIQLADGSTLESGDVSGVVLTRASVLDMPTVIVRLFTPAQVARHRRIAPFSAVRELTIRSADGRPVPVQVDGDHVADLTEAELSVAPGALAVVS